MAIMPWRWRDEHTQRPRYYDGTPVAGPFNSEVMEDVLMMKAYGIPCGVYWIDRPWGPGQPWGYDDFEIDEKRLPNFAPMVTWLNEQHTQMLLWIAPFYQGKMAKEALSKGYNLAGQVRPSNGNNYPMVDLTNPAAKTYWQEGIAKLSERLIQIAEEVGTFIDRYVIGTRDGHVNQLAPAIRKPPSTRCNHFCTWPSRTAHSNDR